MSTDQLVVAGIGLKPERESGTDDWDEADELVDQDVECHATENDFRDLAPDSVNNHGDRDQCDRNIAEARN